MSQRFEEEYSSLIELFVADIYFIPYEHDEWGNNLEMKFIYNLRIFIIGYEKMLRKIIIHQKHRDFKRFLIKPPISIYDYTEDDIYILDGGTEIFSHSCFFGSRKKTVSFNHRLSILYEDITDPEKKERYDAIKREIKFLNEEKKWLQCIFGHDTTDLYPWDEAENHLIFF